MKQLTMALLTMAQLAAGAREDAKKPTLRVCLDAAGKAPVIDGGRAVATGVFAQAGIRIEWRNTEQPCEGGKGIVVTVSTSTPKEKKPGALAYAMPYTRTHAVLLLDRILESARPSAVPSLMGYVLAHEIAHLLQGRARHSESGILKAHWDSRDHGDIQLGRLRFAPEDMEMLFEGVARMR